MMEFSESESRILEYLHDSASIRSLEHLVEGDVHGSDGAFNISPWRIPQICYNTGGLSSDKILDLVTRLKDVLTIIDDLNDNQKIGLVPGQSLPEISPRAGKTTIETLTGISVRDAFTVMLMKKVDDLSEKMKNWVKKEDAIFGIKNSIMLPDDFVPASWMSVVENDEPVESSLTLDDISCLSGKRVMYIYSSFSPETVTRPYFLFPKHSSVISASLSAGDISNRILQEFERIQTSEKFSDFSAGRILKSVLRNMETKNTRELKRQFFDNKKLEFLMKEGLVTEENGKFLIKESVDGQYLKGLLEKYMKLTKEFTEGWMNSTIN